MRDTIASGSEPRHYIAISDGKRYRTPQAKNSGFNKLYLADSKALGIYPFPFLIAHPIQFQQTLV